MKVSRELFQKQGFEAVNIRTIASACGISVGTIYNYFDSKSDLISAIVENIWDDIFQYRQETLIFNNIELFIGWIYDCLKYGEKQYPNFFKLHSLLFLEDEKIKGKILMNNTWEHILEKFSFVIKQDIKVKPDAFNNQITPEKFANLLFSMILGEILRKKYNPSLVIDMIRKFVY